VKIAMAANYHATLSVDYTPSVRGGPIFSDVILSSDPISYPFCDEDADIFIALDQNGFERASECVNEKTISFIDANTITNPEENVQKGTIHRVHITKIADENQLSDSVNIISLGFLSEYLSEKKLVELKSEHYQQVFDKMPERFRNINLKSFELGKLLYQEAWFS
jgi:Pyruvate/2-oxoacid:ferredoxin oxidoreductase gamma subunit